MAISEPPPFMGYHNPPAAMDHPAHIHFEKVKVKVTRKQWRKQARILAKRVTELQDELDTARAANKALSVRCGAFMDAMDAVSSAVAKARMDAVRKTA